MWDASDTLSVSAIDTAGTVGTVTLVGGVVSYDPNGQFERLAVGETVDDTFGYTVSDGNGGTDSATVTVTVIGTNDGRPIPWTVMLRQLMKLLRTRQPVPRLESLRHHGYRSRRRDQIQPDR